MEEENIYGDLGNVDLGSKVIRLEGHNKTLLNNISVLQNDIQRLCQELTQMKKTEQNLRLNISKLFATSKLEIERKDRMIADLRSQLDDLLFRRRKRGGFVRWAGNCTRKRFSSEDTEQPSKRPRQESEEGSRIEHQEPEQGHSLETTKQDDKRSKSHSPPKDLRQKLLDKSEESQRHFSMEENNTKSSDRRRKSRTHSPVRRRDSRRDRSRSRSRYRQRERSRHRSRSRNRSQHHREYNSKHGINRHKPTASTCSSFKENEPKDEEKSVTKVNSQSNVEMKQEPGSNTTEVNKTNDAEIGNLMFANKSEITERKVILIDKVTVIEDENIKSKSDSNRFKTEFKVESVDINLGTDFETIEILDDDLPIVDQKIKSEIQEKRNGQACKSEQSSDSCKNFNVLKEILLLKSEKPESCVPTEHQQQGISTVKQEEGTFPMHSNSNNVSTLKKRRCRIELNT